MTEETMLYIAKLIDDENFGLEEDQEVPINKFTEYERKLKTKIPFIEEEEKTDFSDINDILEEVENDELWNL